jgi:hypothetical protein
MTLPAVITKDFRRLKWHEVVSRGDFVVDDSQGLTAWDGPSGFQAGSFIKLIYRRIKGCPAAGPFADFPPQVLPQ